MSPVKRVESTLPKSVQRLMQLIFNQDFFAETMIEMHYDANKLPLGYVVLGAPTLRGLLILGYVSVSSVNAPYN